MSTRRFWPALALILVALPFAASAREIYFAPQFYPNPEAALAALNESSGKIRAVVVQAGGARVESTFERAEFSGGRLVLHCQKGDGGIAVANVVAVVGWAIDTDRYELAVYTSGDEWLDVFSASGTVIARVANAVATLAAAGGGHLYERPGIIEALAPDEAAEFLRGVPAGKLSPGQGVVIGAPLPGSPAERAGFRRGDVVVLVKDVPLPPDGKKGDVPVPERQGIEAMSSMLLACQLARPGGEIRVGVQVLVGSQDFVRPLPLRDLAAGYTGPRLK